MDIKCKSFRITLKRNFIRSVYKINGTTLESVETIRDLGVILDQKLTFSDQITAMVSKGNRALGLLIRSFQSASPRSNLDKKAALAAFNANVRSVLEYSSVIWAGAARCHLVRVERVQHKFLMWLSHSTDVGCPSLAYDNLLKFYGLQSLQARRLQCDVLFVYKVFKGYFASSHLLEFRPSCAY